MHIDPDRKSTRLNSSHLGIAYAVFCLKKKYQLENHITPPQHFSGATQIPSSHIPQAQIVAGRRQTHSHPLIPRREGRRFIFNEAAAPPSPAPCPQEHLSPF